MAKEQKRQRLCMFSLTKWSSWVRFHGWWKSLCHNKNWRCCRLICQQQKTPSCQEKINTKKKRQIETTFPRYSFNYDHTLMMWVFQYCIIVFIIVPFAPFWDLCYYLCFPAIPCRSFLFLPWDSCWFPLHFHFFLCGLCILQFPTHIRRESTDCWSIH